MARTPSTPGRYDGGVCAGELPLRDTISQKKRKIAEAYHLPSTAAWEVRIGKETDGSPIPNPAEGVATSGSGVSGESLLKVSAGADDKGTPEA